MTTRRGAAKGSGRKGYYNLRQYPKDPKVHAEAAKGMKQPQRIPAISKYIWQDRVALKHFGRSYEGLSHKKQEVIDHIFVRRYGSGKNLQAKMRKKEAPYETWKSPDGTWEYRVLKKYQEDDDKPYARWMVAARTPATFGSWDMGDMYVKDIKANMVKVQQSAHKEMGGKSPEPKGTPKERIIRLHNEGYSSAAIALRTGMPIRYIESVTDGLDTFTLWDINKITGEKTSVMTSNNAKELYEFGSKREPLLKGDGLFYSVVEKDEKVVGGNAGRQEVLQ